MKITQSKLNNHLLTAAGILRNKTAGQDYKNYILSVLFYKCLCDQWDSEVEASIINLEIQQNKKFSEKEKNLFRKRGTHRFSIPTESHWSQIIIITEEIGAALNKATGVISNANPELNGVFTVDWNQPTPDSTGRKLIPNETVHALIQHFNEINLSNKFVPSDVLGKSYEYLIKYFADDAGTKAGEFFTPPEVVEVMVRILKPLPSDLVYDPTVGSGGMLIGASKFLISNGYKPNQAQYFGQESNWSNFALGKINSILHNLEAELSGGESTITNPAFFDGTKLKKFSCIFSNFPFSDEMWWLKQSDKIDDKKQKKKLKESVFKDGFEDKFKRFGKGTSFESPPASYGDFAFILHIFHSLSDKGRAAIVCPQGVLFRGQQEKTDDTGKFNKDGTKKIKKRKADSEFSIRKKLIELNCIDAVIALPHNLFFGAGLPACLLILKKNKNNSNILLINASKFFKKLSKLNVLTPENIMKIMVHYEYYKERKGLKKIIEKNKNYLLENLTKIESEEIDIVDFKYEAEINKEKELKLELKTLNQQVHSSSKNQKKIDSLIKKITKGINKIKSKLEKKEDEKNDILIKIKFQKKEIKNTFDKLILIYNNPKLLEKEIAIINYKEIEENFFNLNIPRYVNTFEPLKKVDIKKSLENIDLISKDIEKSNKLLKNKLRKIKYD